MAAKFSQLRELARQFAAGQIGRDDYRRDRRAMLDQIGGGKLAVVYREITPPKPSSPPTVIMDVGEDEPGSHRLSIILGALLLVTAVGAGGWWYLQRATVAPAELVNVAPKAPGVIVIEQFLSSNDWSSAGVADFEGKWAALDPTQQSEARSDPAFGRLERDLRSRIEDQVSVLDLDKSGKAQSEVARLRDFGARMGVGVP